MWYIKINHVSSCKLTEGNLNQDVVDSSEWWRFKNDGKTAAGALSWKSWCRFRPWKAGGLLHHLQTERMQGGRGAEEGGGGEGEGRALQGGWGDGWRSSAELKQRDQHQHHHQRRCQGNCLSQRPWPEKGSAGDRALQEGRYKSGGAEDWKPFGADHGTSQTSTAAAASSATRRRSNGPTEPQRVSCPGPGDALQSGAASRHHQQVKVETEKDKRVPWMHVSFAHHRKVWWLLDVAQLWPCRNWPQLSEKILVM